MRISDWSSDVCSSDLLKGKTIAVDGAGTTPYFVLMVMLHRNGLGPKDVQFATLAPNPAAQAFVAGQYDAASTSEPYPRSIRNAPSAGKIIAPTVTFPEIGSTSSRGRVFK